jgi:hypothetical protein
MPCRVSINDTPVLMASFTPADWTGPVRLMATVRLVSPPLRRHRSLHKSVDKHVIKRMRKP